MRTNQRDNLINRQIWEKMENYRKLNNGVGKILTKRLSQLLKVATIE